MAVLVARSIQAQVLPVVLVVLLPVVLLTTKAAMAPLLGEPQPVAVAVAVAEPPLSELTDPVLRLALEAQVHPLAVREARTIML